MVQRIVSLIASATEMVCALGLRARLVGRSHECDFPSDVHDLPVCSRPKLDIHASSGAIDRQVKALLSQRLSIYDVDTARLRELRPDVVITQSQCEVCAVSEADVAAALDGWTGPTLPRLVILHPNVLADVWRDLQTIAEACGVGAVGQAVVRDLTARAAVLARQAAATRARPTVACIDWVDPLMTAGNWVPELVEAAGGRCLFVSPGQHAPALAWADLVAADPDAIILMPCGYDLERTLREVPLLESRPEWPNLRAVRQGRVFGVDGNAYFNRPGPRLVESQRILAEILHPEAFPPTLHGTGWRAV